jgi:hypothetical protein
MDDFDFNTQALWIVDNNLKHLELADIALAKATLCEAELLFPLPIRLSRKIYHCMSEIIESVFKPSIHGDFVEFDLADDTDVVWVLAQHRCEGNYQLKRQYEQCKAVENVRETLMKMYKTVMKEGRLGRMSITDYFYMSLARRSDGMWLEITPVDADWNLVQLILRFSQEELLQNS